MGMSRRLWAYVVLVFAVSVPFYALAAANHAFVSLVMFGPAISALVVVLWTQHNVRGLGWGLRKPLYVLWGLLIPLAYCLVAYGVCWLTGVVKFDPSIFAKLYGGSGGALRFVLAVVSMVLLSIPLTLGEELGWRGFMMPEIARTKPWLFTVVASAIIWIAWHVPGMIWGGYNGGTPLWYGLIWFALFAGAITPVLGWLRFASDSVWPAVALHLSSNFFVQAVFDQMSPGAGAKWIIGEFGPALGLVAIVIAALLWKAGERACNEWVASHPETWEVMQDDRAPAGTVGGPAHGA